MRHIVLVTKNMMSGGSERVLSILANYLSDKGIKVTLIILKKTEIFYKISPAVECIFVDESLANKSANKFFVYKKVREIIMHKQPDIVLSMPEEIGIFVLMAMIGSGIPVVVSERNNPWVMPYKKITRFFRKVAYNFSAGFIFQTRNAASFFSENIRNRGIVLPNPLDTSNIPEVFEGMRRKVVVASGRLFEQKNFRLLFDAFADFYKTHQEYSLLIFGEGPLRKELEDYADGILVKGSWRMPGHSPDWLKEARDCAMFVLSSDYEGMPNALIEALAAGIPSVSTDCPSGGSADIIENEINGLLVPVGDKNALYAAMCRIADDKDFAEKISKNAVNVKNKLDSEVVCRRWFDYLEGKIKK